jgi:hypothetical protein
LKRDELTWGASAGGASPSSDDGDECFVIPAGPAAARSGLRRHDAIVVLCVGPGQARER